MGREEKEEYGEIHVRTSCGVDSRNLPRSLASWVKWMTEEGRAVS